VGAVAAGSPAVAWLRPGDIVDAQRMGELMNDSGSHGAFFS
jgi:hypothetical protein